MATWHERQDAAEGFQGRVELEGSGWKSDRRECCLTKPQPEAIVRRIPSLYALMSIQSDFEAINAGIEDGRWLENLTRDAQTALKMALGTSWDGLWDDSTKTLSTTLGDSMVDGFKNGFDNSSAIWDKGFDQLAQVGDKTLSKLISGLSDKLLDFLGSVAWDSLLKPLGSDLGLDKGLGGIVGTLTSAASSVGGTVASWLGIAPAGAGAGAAGAASLAAMADVGGYFGVGGASEFATEGAALAGGESAGLSGLFSGGAGSFLSVAAPIAGSVLGMELFANTMGLPGPIENVMGAFSGGGHTQESALASINADMEYLARATQEVQTALETAAAGSEAFGAS